MPAATYLEIPPSAATAAWVECFWYRRPAPVTGTTPVQRVLPDGCADVILDLTHAAEGRAHALVVGTMRRPLVRQPVAGEAFLGVRFRPGRASGVLGVPLHELTDRHEPLAAMAVHEARELAERIGEAPSLRDRVALLERFVAGHVAGARQPAPWVLEAADRIVASAGRVGIDELASALGVSRQALARRFAEHVGLPPKGLARVMRFRRLLHLAARRQGRAWADLAVEAGYYDQAHMIGEVKRLGGVVPSEIGGA
jgi:AraC-like DNA-binding protein